MSAQISYLTNAWPEARNGVDGYRMVYSNVTPSPTWIDKTTFDALRDHSGYEDVFDAALAAGPP